MTSSVALQRLLDHLEAHKPAGVQRYVVRVGEDATGDPAVWVWVILEGPWPGYDEREKLLQALREQVGQVWQPGAEPPLVYVYFRSADEQREVERVESR